MIKASQLAACVGKNKYCSQKESLIRLWCEKHPYYDAPVKCWKPEVVVEAVTTKDISAAVLHKDADAEQIVDAILKVEEPKVEEPKVEEPKVEEPKVEEPKVSRTQLINAVDHIISTSKGIQGEESTIEMYASKRGVKVNEGNDHLRKFPIQPKWWLIGVTDAHHVDTHLPVIIEVKTRRNHLFRGIPEYEKVQLHAYMYLYRCTSITWVQRYKDQVTWKDIEWDKEFWNEVLRGVKEFCAEYKKLEKMSKEERTTWTNS